MYLILGFRWVSHLGPYFIPEMVRSNLLESLVTHIDREEFYCPAKAAALASVEALTQRRAAIMHILENFFRGSQVRIPPSVLDRFESMQLPQGENLDKIEGEDPQQQKQEITYFLLLQFIFDELVQEGDTKSTGKTFSHFDILLRITMDLLTSLPPEFREVSYKSICKLVKTQSDFWAEKPKYEECRATVILKLLENRQNALKILEKEGLLYQNDPEMTEPIDDRISSPVLDYLYGNGKVVYPPHILPTSGMLFSGECHNLFRGAIHLINSHAATGMSASSKGSENKESGLPLPPSQERQTISLEKKLDIHATQQVITFSSIYVCLRFLLTPENVTSIGWRSFLPLAKTWVRTTRGVAILEIFYRLHESLIQSARYYNDTSYMFKCSAFMTTLGVFVTSCVIHTHKFVIIPFLLLRIYRDGLFDSYRYL
ncbi:hypothetical protein IE077_000992 [Cardiosporidium cionae]|uniref:Uncharacterized protein n=1 Tax=Cardiosporidium cionae TaxID=476202 RepID=A0ABQ7JG96_9APIC|nr:hypothetical protein IE077_000992 [Cardiosporidium cionae]|eukprot:KAF8823070.1 hypothetical protein IE077_000992 [Cardiosporidium cionae]